MIQGGERMGFEKEVYWQLAVMIFGVGNKRIWQLSNSFESVQDFVAALLNKQVEGLLPEELQNISKYGPHEAELILKTCKERGQGCLCYDDERYPKSLKRLYNPPAMLYYKGDREILNKYGILHVVGTRQPSEYSLRMTEYLCTKLTESGTVLSSGFAEGIDSKVCETSLALKSKPVAVLASPIDTDYPKGSTELKNRVAESGLVISEYYPTSKQGPSAFTMRNRISVGIAFGVLFIEASNKSHGLNNSLHALAQGKPVYALTPHDITDKRYYGQTELLRNGAVPVYSADDILADAAGYEGVGSSFFRRFSELKQPQPERKRKPKADKGAKAGSRSGSRIDTAKLSEKEALVYTLLSEGSMMTDELAAKTDMEISQVFELLTTMEINGYVEALPGNQYALIK